MSEAALCLGDPTKRDFDLEERGRDSWETLSLLCRELILAVLRGAGQGGLLHIHH